MGPGRPTRQFRDRIAGIAIPRPFTVDAPCERIAQHRGRPLRLQHLPHLAMPGQPCGMWIATDTVDYIFHARGASPLHQRNIILHELVS
jgi:hypothetical protein